MNIYKKNIFLIFIALLLCCKLQAAPFTNMPYTIVQPDGEQIACFVSGDEFFHRIHDADGYTIIQSSNDGYYYYAQLVGEELVPTTSRVGKADPALQNIKRGLVIPSKVYSRLKAGMEVNNVKDFTNSKLGNIVIFIRYNDDAEFPVQRQNYIDKLCSTTTNSLRSYFLEASYNYLEIKSNFYPTCDSTTNLSIKDSHNRGYLSPYNVTTNPIGYTNDGGSREQNVIADAIENVKSQIPSGLNVDLNNDNYVDNVTIIFRGPNDGWGKVLWAHRWSLYMKTVYINGKRVGSYTFQPENQCNVGTMCHEMFHTIGAPDLYHYTDNGITPVGPWDIMQTGYSHMCAYMKWKYTGKTWITNIPEIKTPGKYKLLPLVSSKNCCFKIVSPYSSAEYFVVEFRKKTGLYETSIPGSGLVIYRVNPGARGNGNGPPDELYSFRPNGTIWSNGYAGNAHFDTQLDRGNFNGGTNPRCFLSDGTDGGITISNITNHNNDSLTFDFDLKKVSDKSKWKIIYFDSEEYDSRASYAIDGNPLTIWHTGWRASTPPYPHEIQIDLGEPSYFRTIRYTPRQDMANGRIKNYTIFSSKNALAWGDTLTKGFFPNSMDVQVLGFPSVKSRYIRFIGNSEVNGNVFASIAEVDLSDQAALIPKAGWKVIACNSFSTGGEAILAIDDKASTFWHTKYSPTTDPFPHFITIDMGRYYSIESFNYLPRQDGNPNGTILNYTLQTSIDSINWVTASSGVFVKNTGEKKINFTAHVARYFKFTGLSEYNSNAFASAAEISMFGVPTNDVTPPSAPVNLNGSTITLKQYRLNWDQSIDDPSIFYHVFINDTLYGVTDTASILIATNNDSLVYPISIKIQACDGSGNISPQTAYMAQNILNKVPVLTQEDIRIISSNGGLFFTIRDNKTCKMELFDITGRIVWHGEISGTQFIPLKPGLCILLARFKCGGNAFTKKITR